MKNKKKVLEKSFAFAVKVIEFYKPLSLEKKKDDLIKNLIISGTVMGAELTKALCEEEDIEAIFYISRAFDASVDTIYYLDLLLKVEYITKEQYEKLYVDCQELIKLLREMKKYEYLEVF